MLLTFFSGGGQALSIFATTSQKTSEEKFKFTFKLYDVDGDGFISNADLFHILKVRGFQRESIGVVRRRRCSCLALRSHIMLFSLIIEGMVSWSLPVIWG